MPDIAHELARSLAVAAGGPILALDAALPRAALCLADASRGVISNQTLDATARPSEALMETVDQVLRGGGIVASNLAAVVVGLGPGSFTGLRVALAAAKGLAYGANASLYGVSSMRAMARGRDDGTVAVCLDARAQWFFGVFEKQGMALRDVVAPAVVKDEAARAWFASCAQSVVALSDSADRARAVVGDADAVRVVPAEIDGTCLLWEAADRLEGGQSDGLDALVPHYLQLSEAERHLTRSP